MSLFRKPERPKATKKGGKAAALSKSVGRKDSAGLDADIAALSNSLAQAEAEKKENSYESLDLMWWNLGLTQ